MNIGYFGRVNAMMRMQQFCAVIELENHWNVRSRLQFVTDETELLIANS